MLSLCSLCSFCSFSTPSRAARRRRSSISPGRIWRVGCGSRFRGLVAFSADSNPNLGRAHHGTGISRPGGECRPLKRGISVSFVDTVSGLIDLLKRLQGRNNEAGQPLPTFMSFQSRLDEIGRRTREEFGGIDTWQLPPAIHGYRQECEQFLLDLGCTAAAVKEIEGRAPAAIFTVLEAEFLHRSLSTKPKQGPSAPQPVKKWSSCSAITTLLSTGQLRGIAGTLAPSVPGIRSNLKLVYATP